MSIFFRVLGKPGWDNGLFVWVDTGTKIYRLLFDCGENILKDLDQRDIKSIDYLFLSHFHIDHIAGFDYFFRRNYDREKKPVYIYGPADTVGLIHNRLRGFKWNLVKGVPGSWFITETDSKNISTYLFKTSDGYSKKYTVEKKSFNGVLIDNPEFTVQVTFLNHIIPTAAYFVKEKPSFNINKEALKKIGFTSGPWIGKIKDLTFTSSGNLLVGDKSFKIKALRDKLLQKKEGESIGYLTDFIYERETAVNIKKMFRNCDNMICESQYLSTEKEYAVKNYHSTAVQAARLARAANAKRLFLFHISDRYKIKDYRTFLYEARKVFPETYFPTEWKIKS